LSRGLAPLEGFTWHGCPWCLLYIEQVPGGLLTSISHRGLTSPWAKGPCRSRVLRGMGACGVCSTSSRSRAAFSRRYPIKGCFYLEPRARAARGFYAAWAPVAPALCRAGPRRPSRVDIPSRVVFIWSRGLVPLEGFTRHGRPWRLLYVEQVPGGLLASISHRGLFLFRARGSPRSRVLLAWQGTRALNAPRSKPRFCSASAPF
jgi:hypothetical protein